MNARALVVLGLLVSLPVRAQEPPPWREGEPVLCDPSTHAPPRRPNVWTPIATALVERDFERLEALLEELRRSPRLPKSVWNRWMQCLDDMGHPDWLEHIDAWCAARPASSVALTVRGEARTVWAWQARGSGWAHTVTDEGWRLFRERLLLARVDLERAAELDPKNVAAPTFLITVAMGLGLDRAQTQAYVDRAAAADPREPEPHHRFITYLLPKWHGEDGDALRYAREVANRAGADPALRGIVTHAHRRLCESLEDADQRRYFAQARDEIEDCYAALLATYPDSLEYWRGLAEMREMVHDDASLKARARCIELDDPDSMVRMGRCYERGLVGLKRDPIRAARLFCRAAWLGYKGAKPELAALFLDGKAGVPVNHPRGLMLLREAVDAGDLEAQYLMGRALHDGAYGLTREPARGRQLVTRAAQQGHIAASGLVGRWLYLAGDLEQGIGLLQQAASNDDPASQLLMGEIAGFGRALGGPEVEPNPRHGAIYFRWAVKHEVPGARERLVELLKKHPEHRQAGDPQ